MNIYDRKIQTIARRKTLVCSRIKSDMVFSLKTINGRANSVITRAKMIKTAILKPIIGMKTNKTSGDILII